MIQREDGRYTATGISVNDKKFDIPIDKLYHPMSPYWEHPTIFNKIICEVRMFMWRTLMNLGGSAKYVKDTADHYGIFCHPHKEEKEVYYFQYRYKDFKKYRAQ